MVKNPNTDETKPAEDIVRVLRIVQYEGPRSLVEKQIENSIHGMRYGLRQLGNYEPENRVQITAVTLGEFPQVLTEAQRTPDPRMVVEMQAEVADLREELRLTDRDLRIARKSLEALSAES
jgi:hypothetical protein